MDLSENFARKPDFKLKTLNSPESYLLGNVRLVTIPTMIQFLFMIVLKTFWKAFILKIEVLAFFPIISFVKFQM